jgi:hypothetical protein
LKWTNKKNQTLVSVLTNVRSFIQNFGRLKRKKMYEMLMKFGEVSSQDIVHNIESFSKSRKIIEKVSSQFVLTVLE